MDGYYAPAFKDELNQLAEMDSLTAYTKLKGEEEKEMTNPTPVAWMQDFDEAIDNAKCAGRIDGMYMGRKPISEQDYRTLVSCEQGIAKHRKRMEAQLRQARADALREAADAVLRELGFDSTLSRNLAKVLRRMADEELKGEKG